MPIRAGEWGSTRGHLAITMNEVAEAFTIQCRAVPPP